MRLPRPSPLKQIRKFCLDCCGGSTKSVRFCHSVDCSLWFLRFGRYPGTFVRENGKKSKQLFDKDNFKKGAKFSPDLEIEEYKL
jgi:hypothetical protein